LPEARYYLPGADRPTWAIPCHGAGTSRGPARLDSDRAGACHHLWPARNGPIPFRNSVSQAGANPREHSGHVCWWTANLLL